MKPRTISTTPFAVQITAKVVKWALLILYLIIALLPILWLIMSSFKSEFEIISSPLAFPTSLNFVNYINAIRISGLHRFFINSFIVTAFATTLNLFFCSLAAFAVAREEWRFKSWFLTFATAMVLIPIIAFMVPYYSLITTIRLYNTIWALVAYKFHDSYSA